MHNTLRKLNKVGLLIALVCGVVSCDPDGPENQIIAGGRAHDDEARAVLVQPNGRIVAVGYSNNDSQKDLAMVRLRRNGDLDPYFGHGGVVVAPLGYPGRGDALALQPDGKILVAGQVWSEHGTRISLARFQADGSLDNSFGQSGWATETFNPSRFDSAWAIGMTPQNKIALAGFSSSHYGWSAHYSVSHYGSETVVAGFNEEGSLNRSFGKEGKVFNSEPVEDEHAHALIVQPDGKILVGGESFQRSHYVFALMRLNADGSLDNTFGTSGRVRMEIRTGKDAFGWALALQSDGKVLMGGESFDGFQYHFALARFNPDGTPDAEFGAGGNVLTPLGEVEDTAKAVAVDKEGRIFLAGNSYDGSRFRMALVRYTVDGRIDKNFGKKGQAFYNIGSAHALTNAIAIAPNGKLVLVGAAHNGDDYDFAFLRLYSNGTIDNHFADSGKKLVDITRENTRPVERPSEADPTEVEVDDTQIIEMKGTLQTRSRLCLYCFEVGVLGVLQSSLGGAGLSGELAWTPSLEIADSHSIRLVLGVSAQKSATTGDFILFDFQAFYSYPISENLFVEPGGGAELWLNFGGVRFLAGANFSWKVAGPRKEDDDPAFLQNVFLGYSAIFDTNMAHQIRVGAGMTF